MVQIVFLLLVLTFIVFDLLNSDTVYWKHFVEACRPAKEILSLVIGFVTIVTIVSETYFEKLEFLLINVSDFNIHYGAFKPDFCSISWVNLVSNLQIFLSIKYKHMSKSYLPQMNIRILSIRCNHMWLSFNLNSYWSLNQKYMHYITARLESIKW